MNYFPKYQFNFSHYHCLNNVPINPKKSDFLEPYGQSWSLDEQCRQEFGREFQLCQAVRLSIYDRAKKYLNFFLNFCHSFIFLVFLYVTFLLVTFSQNKSFSAV